MISNLSYSVIHERELLDQEESHLVHLRLPLAADDVDPDVPVGRHAHALEEEVETVADELVGHPAEQSFIVIHQSTGLHKV